eukprot:scaffold33086_cov63-Phaeocystis_antarctica.AAC.1
MRDSLASQPRCSRATACSHPRSAAATALRRDSGARMQAAGSRLVSGSRLSRVRGRPAQLSTVNSASAAARSP